MDGTFPRQTFSISGMHCANCVRKVSDALRGLPGVTGASVTLDPPEARVDASRVLSAGELAAALQPLGTYGVTAETATTALDHEAAAPPGLYPLYLIVGYIALVVGLVAKLTGDWSAHAMMTNFMAGFFLVFSFFKLLDLAGFADAYRSYDLVASAVPGWAKAYPFVELALGIAYLTRFQPALTNLVTLTLMVVGALGVWKALADKKRLRCACLGTALNLPMTTVTLVEDLGMAAMAALMLLL